MVSRRCTTARYMRLYIRKTDISPIYNREVLASVYIRKTISPMYNGEVHASDYEKD